MKIFDSVPDTMILQWSHIKPIWTKQQKKTILSQFFQNISESIYHF